MPIPSGVPAPDFKLKDQNGMPHRLQEYLGKPVVLYFYPKDDTPGCTKEACSFRDAFAEYKEAGVVVLGVSPDDSESHRKFATKYNLPFTLLADEGHQVAELYGVWGKKKRFGREYEGIHRTTFLINESGIIQQVFEDVKPENHSQEVLAALQKSG
ncbi:MAG TPA: thioredoxin-dependent thiol peroxidase [Chloroflexi bacterium]|nr:thioredoxin-dependent thiol peroxidase [Chloroflexota bacterium]HPO58285.1 thioredoxin-dependent thiol peroxidase [Anaerolineaceae bacterium]